jgi:hypothetical protein
MSYKGNKHSDATKARIAHYRTGKKHSDEVKQKIGSAVRNTVKSRKKQVNIEPLSLT